MTKEKNLNKDKQTDKSQDQFTDERLNDDELDGVAGGDGDYPTRPDNFPDIRFPVCK